MWVPKEQPTKQASMTAPNTQTEWIQVQRKKDKGRSVSKETHVPAGGDVVTGPSRVPNQVELRTEAAAQALVKERPEVELVDKGATSSLT